MVWLVEGDSSVLATTMKEKLDKHTEPEQVLVFDKYKDMSAKEHERVRRAGVGSVDYNLNIQTLLPHREAIMKSKKNELSKIMLDYSPTDQNGNLDYRKGMKILVELGKVKETEKHSSTQAKKDIADATVSKETAGKDKKDFYTNQDFKGKDYRSFINN